MRFKRNKILTCLGLLLVVIVLFGGGGIWLFVRFANHLDESSQAFVDNAVPAIVGQWSKDELYKYASPSLKQVASDESVEAMFSKFATLGPLVSCSKGKGEARMLMIFGGESGITANYVVDATFANGSASIAVRLVRARDSWEITGFRVSPIFRDKR